MTTIGDESASGSMGRTTAPAGPVATAEELYLDLVKKCLTRSIFEHLVYEPITVRTRSLRGRLKVLVYKWLRDSRQIEMVRIRPFDFGAREQGRDWPLEAETMIGLRRLDNIEYCVTDVLRQQVPGDLIETGVWRGGAAIFMRAILKAYKNTERIVWVADSFEGLPKPDPERFPADAGDRHWTNPIFAVSLEEVKANFARYNLLDEQVRFLVGWFRDTLPTSPIRQLAVLRLDGDMYESTMDSLRNLYPKLSKGGYVIIDDYGAIPGCRAAVDDFRKEHKIITELQQIDWTGMFWQRQQ
jgi:O-methyltransferase